MLTQYALFSLLLACVLRRVARLGAPRWVDWAGLAFFALFPGLSVYSVTITKDVVFSALFALVALRALDMVRAASPDARPAELLGLRRPAVASTLATVALLACFLLFRNNAVYAWVLFCLVALALLRRRALVLLVPSACALLLWWAVTGPLSSLAGVVLGSKSEMLSVPMQQMALVRQQADDLSDEERGYLDALVPDWASYDPLISDPVKSTFGLDVLAADKSAFVTTYLSLGLRHPLLYLDAALSLSDGLWDPRAFYGDYEAQAQAGTPWTYLESNMTPWSLDLWPYDGEFVNHEAVDGLIYIEAQPLCEPLRELYEWLSWGAFEERVPVLRMLFSTGFWLWAALFGVTYALYVRRRALAVPGLMLACYWVTLVFGPTSLYRYAMPVFVLAPAIVALLLVPRPSAVRPMPSHDIPPRTSARP